MFKFSFNEPDKVEGSQNEDVKWHKCKEITLSNINHNLTNQSQKTITVGNKTISIIASLNLNQELNNYSDNILQAEKNHSDLISGIYEGGLKIWECTYDLLEYLNGVPSLQWKDKNVLDLGCGAGLLGLTALVNGAKVTFQDYNSEVLENLTGRNVILNASPEIPITNVRFFSGDWLSFSEKLYQEKPDELYDIILTSETIYNPLSYEKLHGVFLQLLSTTGVIYVAGKSVYFGVGGTMHAFIEFVKSKNKFDIEICWSNKEGVSREICRLSKKLNNAMK